MKRLQRSHVVSIAVLVLGMWTWGCHDDPQAPTPTEFQPVEVRDDVVRLRWSGTGAPVRLLRTFVVPPSGPFDSVAQLVYAGSAQVADDPLVGLEPAHGDSAYHYVLYDCTRPACDEVGRAEVRPTLTQCLRAGGYTIYWRHADADVCGDRIDFGTADTTDVPDWWRSCVADCDSATARQLNDEGVANAIAIGQQFDTRRIPIGRVLSSEFCRCFRTAELFDFGPTIELDAGITFFVYGEENRCEHCLDRIGTAPIAGTNTAIIGHGGFGCDVMGELAWSECAIYKPQPGGGYRFIARVTAAGWAIEP